MATVYTVDHDVVHKWFGHPSDDVMRHFPKHVENCPKGIQVPRKIFRGCAEGKMPNQHFAQSRSKAVMPFEKVHSDLKEFPLKSYHGYKWFISFFDGYTSNA